MVFSSHFLIGRKARGGEWDIAFPVNAETWNMIEQAILTEYEKVVAESKPMSNIRSLP
jgi:DNA-binding cell septation regulator SpoVG